MLAVSDLQVGVVALLGLWLEWCNSAAAVAVSRGKGAGGSGAGVQQGRGVQEHRQEQKGGQTEEQLVPMVSHMVHACGESLCHWLREVCHLMRALRLIGGAGAGSASTSTSTSVLRYLDGVRLLLEHAVKALPVMMRVVLLSARTALHTDRAAQSEVPGGSGGGSSGRGAGSAGSANTPGGAAALPWTHGPMGRWEAYGAMLAEWLMFLPFLPPQDQPEEARLGVDLVWCLAAEGGAAGAGGRKGMAVVESEVMEGVLRVAQSERDAETTQKAEAYLDWARKGGSRGTGSSSDRGVGGGEEGRPGGVVGGVPESCLRLEGGAPWLLSVEEVRRRLPRL